MLLLSIGSRGRWRGRLVALAWRSRVGREKRSRNIGDRRRNGLIQHLWGHFLLRYLLFDHVGSHFGLVNVDVAREIKLIL